MNRANNFWGEPDDEPLPDWMDPVKCKQKTEQTLWRKRGGGRSLTEAIEDAMKQPEIHIDIKEPK